MASASAPAVVAVVAALSMWCSGCSGGEGGSATTLPPPVTPVEPIDTTTTLSPAERAAQESEGSPVAIGLCFDAPDHVVGERLDLDAIEPRPCFEPHDDEVFAAFRRGDPNSDFDYDAAVVERAATDGCIERFEGYVGRSYETSVLDIAASWPTERSWDDGDRWVVCVLYDADFRNLTIPMRDEGL